jgi:hypothetical protein
MVHDVRMKRGGLDDKLIERWRRAGEDLGIRVTAPARLRDAADDPLLCEVFVPDFGSPSGGVVVSQRTERRLRAQLRAMGERLFQCIAGSRQQRAYSRSAFIQELEDWGWFGEPGEQPDWYVERR